MTLHGVLMLLALSVAGCSSVGGSAVRTGPLAMPAYSGPVAIYAVGQVPPGAVDLGLIEVHAAQQEATVETLLPQFVRKVADIGGNVAVIEGVRARFEVVGRTHAETFYYACTMGSACSGTRVYATDDEIMIVTMMGHAMTTKPRAPSAAPPLVPAEPLPPDEPGMPIGEPDTISAEPQQ